MMKAMLILLWIPVALLIGCDRNPASNDGSTSPQQDTKPRVTTPDARAVNRASIKVGGYTITTALDVPMSQSMQDQSAVLSFGGHRLLVEFDSQRLTWDEAPPVGLPPGTKEVDVQFTRGDLVLKADGILIPAPTPQR